MTTSLNELNGTGQLLTDLDLGSGQVRELLSLAAGLKAERATASAAQPLQGRNIALVFERPSSHSRRAFEIAATEMGARTTFLATGTVHLGRQESPTDTARALSEIFDGIAYSSTDHATLVELAQAATVPVWNAGTGSWQPVQALADILTMQEFNGDDLTDIAYCFTGDARAPIAASLLTTGARLGMNVRIAAPAHMRPSGHLLSRVHDLARQSGARVIITANARDAVAGAGFVHTAAWVSGDEPNHAWTTHIPSLIPYRVTDQLLLAAGRGDVRFMHGLPAVHNASSALGRRVYRQFGLNGAEVTEAVFRSPRSIVIRQTANRIPVIKALLLSAFDQPR
jgi:ornithine carbamoyltransferase